MPDIPNRHEPRTANDRYLLFTHRTPGPMKTVTLALCVLACVLLSALCLGNAVIPYDYDDPNDNSVPLLLEAEWRVMSAVLLVVFIALTLFLGRKLWKRLRLSNSIA